MVVFITISIIYIQSREDSTTLQESHLYFLLSFLFYQCRNVIIFYFLNLLHTKKTIWIDRFCSLRTQFFSSTIFFFKVKNNISWPKRRFVYLAGAAAGSERHLHLRQVYTVNRRAPGSFSSLASTPLLQLAVCADLIINNAELHEEKTTISSISTKQDFADILRRNVTLPKYMSFERFLQFAQHDGRANSCSTHILIG